MSAIPYKKQVSHTCYSETGFFYMPQMFILILAGKKLCLSFACKRRAMLFPVLPPLSFLTIWFCQTGHLSILHPAQWGLYSGYCPKAQYCRCMALISYKPVTAFVIQCCLMLYAEHQSAGCYSKWLSGNTMRSTMHTPVMVLLPFQEERLLGEWRKMRRENLALVSSGYNNKKR